MKNRAIKSVFVFLICIAVASVCVMAINAIVKNEPLTFFFDDYKSFFSRLNENFIFYPVGVILGLFTQINGGNYLLSIIQLTALIHSLLRPMHSAAKRYSRRIKLASEDVKKIEQKYASIDMPNKDNYINMRKMELYKRYGINPLMYLVLPCVDILAFFVGFTVICRFPYTEKLHNGIDTSILSLDLFNGVLGGFEYFVALFVLAAVYFLIEYNWEKINISTDEMIDVISRRKNSLIYKIRKITVKGGTCFAITMVLVDFVDDLLLLDFWSHDISHILSLISFSGWLVSEIVNIAFPVTEWIVLKIKALRIRSKKAKQRENIENDCNSKRLEESTMTATKTVIFLAGAGLILTNSVGAGVLLVTNSLYNVFSHMEEQIMMIHYVQDRLDEKQESQSVGNCEN